MYENRKKVATESTRRSYKLIKKIKINKKWKHQSLSSIYIFKSFKEFTENHAYAWTYIPELIWDNTKCSTNL